MRVPLWALLVAGCGDGSHVTSDEEAELAWAGLDGALSRAMDLGLLGFSLASSANLDPQSGEGDVQGTMTVDGQADQGNSDNKGLRLEVVVVDYADEEDLDPGDGDEVFVVYDAIGAAEVDLQLKGLPDGTLSGSFVGTFGLEGDLEGEVTLDVTLEGDLQDDGAGGTQRAPETTRATGTATNDGGGSYDIDVTL